MELKQQVCNLELAQKLKELGVNQESLFSYIRYDDGHTELLYTKGPVGNPYWTCAFTVAELGWLLKIAGPDATIRAYGDTEKFWNEIITNVKKV